VKISFAQIYLVLLALLLSLLALSAITGDGLRKPFTDQAIVKKDEVPGFAISALVVAVGLVWLAVRLARDDDFLV
jgi:hypothetical protein